LRKKIIQVQKVLGNLIDNTKKRTSPRHIIVKALNIQKKERILKALREKHQVTYKGKSVRIMVDFSTETLKSRRE
jgi:tRNA A37 threonylcarbamoyladenosine dehydratase